MVRETVEPILDAWKCICCRHVSVIQRPHCPHCGEQNALSEECRYTALQIATLNDYSKSDEEDGAENVDDEDDDRDDDEEEELLTPLGRIDPAEPDRIPTGDLGFNHVLGGGLVLGSVVVIYGPPGTGKCLGQGAPVMMFDGSILPVEDVKVGDFLMGPDSEAREVLSTNMGHGPLYIIKPIKGAPWICNDAHVMTLAGTHDKMGQTIDVPLHEHLSECEAAGRKIDRDWKLLRVPVKFDAQPVYADPYLLGVWIGDGSRGHAAITNREPEIIEFCKNIAKDYGSEVILREEIQKNSWHIRFRIHSKDDRAGRTPGGTHPLWDFFRFNCDDGKGKKIPREYLINSESVRLQLLAGIIDTDGFLDESGTYDLITVSKTLRDQYLFLIRSLGFAGYAKKKTGTIKSIGFSGTYWRICISGDLNRIPCKVERRKAKPREQVKRVTVTGFSATPIGDGDYYGFTLTGDGRFLLGDFTVTHNSTLATLLSASVAQDHLTYYAVGEESKERVRRRITRMGVLKKYPKAIRNLMVLDDAAKDVDLLCACLLDGRPKFCIVDSLMSIASEDIPSQAGSPSQVKNVAKALTQVAQDTQMAILAIAHVTNDGRLAGPSSSKHDVDTLLMLEHVKPMKDETFKVVPRRIPGKSLLRLAAYTKNRDGDVAATAYYHMSKRGLILFAIEDEEGLKLFTPEPEKENSHDKKGSAKNSRRARSSQVSRRKVSEAPEGKRRAAKSRRIQR